MATKSIQAVKDKLKIIAKEKNMDFNSVMRFYMYDRFIDRLSRSRYSKKFILKGGFYLSTLFGINNRSTMDIDTAIRNANFTKNNIVSMIEKIINIDVDDNVILKVEKIDEIREEDEYGGLRITLRFQLEDFNDCFHIDVATGDPIHPGPKKYGYKSLIEDEIYKVWTYSIETFLAEKIETIFNRLETSSRMKDYYDVYLIYNYKFEEIDKNTFRKAVEKTFSRRNFDSDLFNCVDIVRNSKRLQMYWNAYAKKNRIIGNISYEDTIKCLEQFVAILIPTVV